MEKLGRIGLRLILAAETSKNPKSTIPYREEISAYKFVLKQATPDENFREFTGQKFFCQVRLFTKYL